MIAGGTFTSDLRILNIHFVAFPRKQSYMYILYSKRCGAAFLDSISLDQRGRRCFLVVQPRSITRQLRAILWMKPKITSSFTHQSSTNGIRYMCLRCLYLGPPSSGLYAKWYSLARSQKHRCRKFIYSTDIDCAGRPLTASAAAWRRRTFGWSYIAMRCHANARYGMQI